LDSALLDAGHWIPDAGVQCSGFRPIKADTWQLKPETILTYSFEKDLFTSAMEANEAPHIIIQDLTMAFGSFIVQKDLSFTVNRGDVFIVMGGSGCGKSTLLRHMVGLIPPARGRILYGETSFWEVEPAKRDDIMRNVGVLYQSGALWSSMTLAENIGLPLQQYTDLKMADIRELVSLKLSLVGLAGFEDYYPSEISGGMRKRAGLARAIALDPDILYFDEPSAGLDPISARLLDDLILEMRASLGATIVVVTHELASIFAIGNNSIFLDANAKTMIASGDPNKLLAESKDPVVQQFLTRGKA
jgi:phospholipid/cholesterol/gamma-HCH transport system ATP-binding protein